ncbi:MAG: hypothetical protein GTO63_31715 [Anaerolineae bacterium]|nr:hypothetical protein [Anaerolineae bacterium]
MPFILGNLVLANVFVQLMGVIGLPLGIAVSGLLTLVVSLTLERQSV